MTKNTATTKKKKEPTFRTWEITQQVVNSRTGQPTGFGRKSIEAVISNPQVVDWVWILHDKDKYSEYDLAKYKAEHNGEEPTWEVGDLKPPHYHLTIKLAHDAPVSRVAKWAGVPENMVQHKKNGKFAIVDMANYYVRADPDQQEKGKYPYPMNELHAKNHGIEAAMKKRLTLTKLKDPELDALALDIKNDKYISWRDLLDDESIPWLFLAKNKRVIDALFNFQIEKHKSDKGQKVVYYICPMPGAEKKAGIGKSRLLNQLADDICEREGLRRYDAGGTDPFGLYDREEVVCIDDVTFENLPKELLLRLFDPRSQGQAQARYSNKDLHYIKYIFIATYYQLDDNLSKIKGLTYEETQDPSFMQQFIRRITYIKKLDTDYIYSYKYDGNTGKHVFSSKRVNTFYQFPDDMSKDIVDDPLIDYSMDKVDAKYETLTGKKPSAPSHDEHHKRADLLIKDSPDDGKKYYFVEETHHVETNREEVPRGDVTF